MRHADVGSARKPLILTQARQQRLTLQSPRRRNNECHQKEDSEQHAYCGYSIVSICLCDTLTVDLLAKVFTMLWDTLSSWQSYQNYQERPIDLKDWPRTASSIPLPVTWQVATLKKSTPFKFSDITNNRRFSLALPLRTNHFGQVPPILVNVFRSFETVSGRAN